MLVALVTSVVAPAPAFGATIGGAPSMSAVLPAPVSVQPTHQRFQLTRRTVVHTQPGVPAVRAIGDQLAQAMRPATGFPLPVYPFLAQAGPLSAWPSVIIDRPSISLLLGANDGHLGAEGYRLTVNSGEITIQANAPAGLFNGTQTLLQLLPPQIDATTVQRRGWAVAGGTIVDYPRFAYRGAMLDVARHFHTPAEIKRYVDEISRFKVNYLHLHLADDQGWRIQIDSWPRLTEVGGAPGTGVDGVGGGYLTKADYADLVSYAAARNVTIVPEIDMPGHVNAAQVAYPELTCDGVAPAPRTDTEVGYSSLCISSETTYRFVEDVIRELAAMTPGPYLHIGGDEAHATPPADYITFEQKVAPIVAKYGKKITGWHEIAKATPPVSAIPQYWDFGGDNASVAAAAARGNKILMSPANYAYLDMKYNESTPLGQDWAALVEVRDGYDWDPASLVTGVGESQVAGVEAPLWTETIRTSDDIEYMAFPRLPGIAEIGWSPKPTHNWDAYRLRLAKQAPRWVTQGINFYRSPQVDWK